MNDKTKLGLKVLLAIALIGGAVLYFSKKGSPSAKKDKAYWIKNIVALTTKLEGANNGANAATLATFDDGYLQAWSDAIDANSTFFVYKNTSYVTATGLQEMTR